MSITSLENMQPGFRKLVRTLRLHHEKANRPPSRQPNRRCEVCGHRWRTRFAPDVILNCPNCRVSGYHEATHD